MEIRELETEELKTWKVHLQELQDCRDRALKRELRIASSMTDNIQGEIDPYMAAEIVERISEIYAPYFEKLQSMRPSPVYVLEVINEEKKLEENIEESR